MKTSHLLIGAGAIAVVYFVFIKKADAATPSLTAAGIYNGLGIGGVYGTSSGGSSSVNPRAPFSLATAGRGLAADVGKALQAGFGSLFGALSGAATSDTAQVAMADDNGKVDLTAGNTDSSQYQA